MKTEDMSFQVSLENCQGFSILDEGGKFIPPVRTVNENVLNSDFEPLCDGTTRRCSQISLRLLEGM